MRQNYVNTVEKAKGLIQQKTSFTHFDLTRLLPSAELESYIAHYWVITWDLQKKPAYRQENLPHPSQHLVIDPQAGSAIFGVHKEKFTYRLEGSGKVIGVKFHPGAFYGFLRKPLEGITNSNIPISSVFEMDAEQLEYECMAGTSIDLLLESMEKAMIESKPILTEKMKLTRVIVEYIEQNKGIRSVVAVAEKFNMTIRSLQRLFIHYIGVTPKWVIDHYRIIEAVDALNKAKKIDITVLAHSLGYHDQAHFTKIFSQLIACPPAQYLSVANKQ